LREADRLAAEYGGVAADWQKVTSTAYNAADGVQIQIHAYQNSVINALVEIKTNIGKW
jgi:hypothetical protein